MIVSRTVWAIEVTVSHNFVHDHVWPNCDWVVAFYASLLEVAQKNDFSKTNIANTLLRYLVQEHAGTIFHPHMLEFLLPLSLVCAALVFRHTAHAWHMCGIWSRLPGAQEVAFAEALRILRVEYERVLAENKVLRPIALLEPEAAIPRGRWLLANILVKKNISDSSASTYFAEILRTLGKYLPCVFFCGGWTHGE